MRLSFKPATKRGLELEFAMSKNSCSKKIDRKNSTGSLETKTLANSGSIVQKSPGRKTRLPPVPASFDEAGSMDRLILHLKDVEGRPWSEINRAVEDMIGFTLGGSTLSNRYMRIKANFAIFPDDDVSVSSSPFWSTKKKMANGRQHV